MRFVDGEKLLSCVHCGLCQQACPTYVELGTEADSPRGRILLLRALEEGRLEPTAEVVSHLDGCLGCRACETACPSGVPYGSLIEAARPFVERERPAVARAVRRLLDALLTHPTARALAFAPVRAVGRAPWLARLARAARRTPLGPWLAYAAAVPRGRRTAPPPPVVEPEGPPRGTAIFLTGCVAETLFADTARAAIALLARAGVRVLTPLEQGCCGALSLHLGDAARARALARGLLDQLPLDRADWVVGSAAGCGALLRELGHLLPGDPRAESLARRARDPLDLLGEIGLPRSSAPLRRRIAIHDPCHLAHGQGVRAPIRSLLAAVPGVELVELEESDHCCGSAGTYNLTERAMAARLLERKLERIAASGAEVVAAANPGCVLQIRAGAIARGLAVEVEHPLDLLAAAHGVAPARAAG